MSSFEDVILELPEYEVDNEFSAVLAYAQSLNELYRGRGVPVSYEEALTDLAKLNAMWMSLSSQQDVMVNGRVILNNDSNSPDSVCRCNDECIVDLSDFSLRSGKFILHDTLEFDGSRVISGTQEIKFTGLIDVAKLARGFELDYVDEDEDDEGEFDEELEADAAHEEGETSNSDDDQSYDDPRLGVVWGLVSVEQIEQRFITTGAAVEDDAGLLEESCRKHFSRIRERLETLEGLMVQIAALSDLEAIPEHREEAIATYRELLETYLNDKIPFDENIPYILQTDGQYARHTHEVDSGEYEVSDEPKPTNIAVINLSFTISYDEVGLPAIVLHAYDVFGKDVVSSLLSIPLRSVLDIESTKTLLQAKLDQSQE